jgi:hypothetical protein
VLHIVADEGVVLEIMMPRDAGWHYVCTAPCDQAVPEGRYRVSGHGITSSRPFKVHPSLGATATISVSSGTRTGLVLGVALLSTGAVVATVGSVFLALPIGPAVGGGDAGPGQAWTAVWAGTLAAGIGLVIGGLVVFGRNLHSTVTPATTELSTGPTPTPEPTRFAAPVWSGPALPMGATVPLLSTTF